MTLTFLNYYTGSELTLLTHNLIPRFEALNPGIKVESVNVPYADLLPKYLAAAAAGSPYDVFRSDIAWTAELAGDGTALKVSDLAWYPALAEQALPGPLLTTEFKGSAYSLPLDTNTIALFWNKANFRAAGISGPPKTITQLIADAKTLTIPSKDQYGLGVDSTDIWDVSPYIWSYGGSFTNPSYTKASGYMNSGATKVAVAMLVHGYNGGHGFIGPDIINTSGDSGEQEFPSGKYDVHRRSVGCRHVHGVEPSAELWHRCDAVRQGRIAHPDGRRRPRDLKGRQAPGGFRAVRAVPRVPDAQLALAKTGEMSAYSTDTAAEVKADPYERVFADALPNAYVRPVTRFYGLVDTDFSNAFEEILAGKVSVSQGLNQAAHESDAALAGKG